MMPRAARPRIADLTRAIRAFARAGERAEIRIEPDGTIRVIPNHRASDCKVQKRTIPKRKTPVDS